MAQPILWSGSGSSPVGLTPMGYFDTDSEFIASAPKVADWCARRLGYPTMDVEMDDRAFYSAFEEAIAEYSAQVHQFTIRENLFSMLGTPVTETYKTNVNTKTIVPNLNRVIDISDKYGQEVGVGGDITIKKGYINIKSGQQTYDLNELWGDVSESGNRLEIRRIYHTEPVAFSYGVSGVYNAPGVLGSAGGVSPTLGTLSEFGWEGMAAGGMTATGLSYTLMPVYEDILRMQAVEFNFQMRRSGYSFELKNNVLTIFPLPFTDTKIWFDYIVKNDRYSVGPTPVEPMPIYDETGTIIGYTSGSLAGNQQASGSTYDVTNIADAPFTVIPYSKINDPGRRWIMKYTLACSKEMLGEIRSKYSTIPIPDSEVVMNGPELKSEAQQEKADLITQLREDLERTATQMQLQIQKENSENVQGVLKTIPMKIYIG
jgi:hypothetical protein